MSCRGRKRCGNCKECGCDKIIDAQCIRVGRDYDAIGITRGDSLEEALYNLNSKYEELNDIQDGVGILSSNIDENNLLTFTLTDGSVIEAGTITIP